jgi:hypothetical protein
VRQTERRRDERCNAPCARNLGRGHRMFRSRCYRESEA